MPLIDYAVSRLWLAVSAAYWSGVVSGAIGLLVVQGLLWIVLKVRTRINMNNRDTAIAAVLIGLAGLIYWSERRQQPPPPVCPGPNCPAPSPSPDKPRPRRPWGEGAELIVPPREATATVEARLASVGAIKLGGGVCPFDNATEIQVDLPVDRRQRMRNIGSKYDGAGMCVMSSTEMAADWSGQHDLIGIRDWAAQFPGGSYPSKHAKQIAEYAKQKKITEPPYLQYEGGDPAIIKAALESGRLPCITYSGRDGVRYRGPIAHMVTCCYYDDTFNGNEGLACILDNNGPADELIWMNKKEFLSRWAPGGHGWVFLWLAPPPPPPPTA